MRRARREGTDLVREDTPSPDHGPDTYILVDRIPIRVPASPEYRNWMQTSDLVVQRDDLGRGVVVLTRFIGVDMRAVPGTGPPLVFETVAGLDATPHYATWDDAIAGHLEVVRQMLSRVNN